uniref:Protein kinase domain-containing protein n=1 Tax=Heterorhabditis bacteriophora TaxID=37862 RepID=A0A1I7WSG3_HETBA
MIDNTVDREYRDELPSSSKWVKENFVLGDILGSALYSLIDFGLSQIYTPKSLSPGSKENTATLLSPKKRGVKRLSISGNTQDNSDIVEKKRKLSCDCFHLPKLCGICRTKPVKNVNKYYRLVLLVFVLLRYFCGLMNKLLHWIYGLLALHCLAYCSEGIFVNLNKYEYLFFYFNDYARNGLVVLFFQVRIIMLFII